MTKQLELESDSAPLSRHESRLLRRRVFQSPILLTIAANVAMAGQGLATGILAARLLGPEGRGELGAIQLWPSLLATLAMLGLPEALVYYSARDPQRAGRYMGSAMFLALASSIPLMLLGYWLMPYLLSAQTDSVIAASKLYLWLVPLYALVGMPYHPLRGLQDMSWWNGLRILPGLGWLFLLIWAVLRGQNSPQYLSSSYLMILGLLLLPVLWVVTWRVPGPYWPTREYYGPMLRYGLPSATATLPQMLNFRLDQMLIAAFLPVHSLGLYVVAVAWSSAARPVLSAIGSVLFPRVASETTPHQQARVFSQGVRLGALISAAIAGPLLFVTPWVLPWVFGKSFQPAVPAAVVLIVAASVSGLNLILQEGIRGLGNPKVVMWSEFAGLATTFVALWFLLKPFQIMGAAIASLLGYSAVTIYLLANVQQVSGLRVQAMIPSFRDVHAAWHSVRMILFQASSR